MMRPLLVFLVTCGFLVRLSAQENIRPIVAQKFGEPMKIEAEFVAKPNDYNSQNMVPEPFLLRVVSVDGRKLQAPVSIEYKMVGDVKRPRWEKPGAVCKLEAYESLYESGRPNSWMESGEQGRGFVLTNILHVRLARE